VQIFECEMGFNNSRGLDSSSQHILFCRSVTRGGNSCQIVEIAAKAEGLRGYLLTCT